MLNEKLILSRNRIDQNIFIRCNKVLYTNNTSENYKVVIGL